MLEQVEQSLTNTLQLWEEDGNHFRQLASIMKNQKCKLLFPDSPSAVVKLNAFVSWVSIRIPWCVARVLWKGKSLNAEGHLEQSLFSPDLNCTSEAVG